MEQTKPAHRRWSLVVGRYALLAVILLLGAYLRLTGLNWDEGQWIHPDEGHMRTIMAVIKIPDKPSLYFDTHKSPLNCRNSDYRYSYGTLPLFLTRLTAEWLDRGCGESPQTLNQAVGQLLLDDQDQPCRPGDFTGVRSALVGRALAALSDLGTLLLLYLLGRRLYGEAVGLLAAALWALTAFSIQQAHFFSVDSSACFFTVLTAYFAVRAGQSSRIGQPSWLHFGLAGLSTGLATACKVSAALAALLVALAGLWWWTETVRARPSRSPLIPLSHLAPRLILAALLALLAFRVAQPYAFEGPGFLGLRPSPEWFGRLGEIRREQSGELDFPSGRQWTDRAPIIFPLLNIVVWGLGLPLGLAACAGWAQAGLELLRGKRVHLVLWLWTSSFFLYQATRWVKAMRYFLSLYPFFVIMAAYGLVQLCRNPALPRRRLGQGLAVLVLVGAALWSYAVWGIYQRPHTRIAASRWIFENVPQGVTVATEHWDWGVPLRIDGHDPFGGMYSGLEMQHYNEDTPAKQMQLFDWLEQADYIFISSNRLYASISRLPTRYPLTTAYYRALFAGELGFELLADFTSRPAIGPLQFPDQETPYPLLQAAYVHQDQPVKIPLPPAEEAFSVYDHPRVLIFRKTPAYSRQLVESMLGTIDVEHAQHGLSPLQATSDLYLLLGDFRLYAGLAIVFPIGFLIYKTVEKRERLVQDE